MQGDSPDDELESGPDQRGAPVRWPLCVRILAVCYVLSLAVQMVGFLLVGAAAFLYGRRRDIDGWVLGLVLAGSATIVACTAFRFWFRRWGRTHYPPQAAARPVIRGGGTPPP
ncbi:MAG TPA: hypothetical protein VMS17_31835 [Gemmataceae bacterium]|nr:hypothetical protein [Gemmataceae bacterium]